MKVLPDWNSDINTLIPFSRVKIIISDIDGTLQVSKSDPDNKKFISLVRTLRSKGVHMTFATGRAYNGVKELINSYPIAQSDPLILYNGSVCIFPSSKKILFKHIISHDSLKALISLVEKYETTLLAYEFISHSTSEKSKIAENVYAWGIYCSLFSEPNGLPIIWGQIDYEISPVAIMIKNCKNFNSSQDLLDKISYIDGITTTKSSEDYIEIRPKGSNKGCAVKAIGDLLRLNKDSILTIGDNDNDVEMLEYAGISVAVNNSSMAARRAGKYLSPGSNITGLNETLNLVWQAYRYKSLLVEGVR